MTAIEVNCSALEKCNRCPKAPWNERWENDLMWRAPGWLPHDFIRKEVGVEWDLEIKVNGKIPGITGNTNWGEEQKF